MPAVRQTAYEIFPHQKVDLLLHLLSSSICESPVLVFVRSKETLHSLNTAASRRDLATENISGNKLSWSYKDENRFGDHIWWVSDVSRFKADYPDWNYQYNMEKIMREIFEGLRQRLNIGG